MKKGKTSRGRADQGYILVFVLGVLMTIGLLMGDVSTRSHLGGSILLNSTRLMENRMITGGGIEIGKVVLGQHLDSGPVRRSIPEFEVQLGGKSIAIKVEDECGKLNLNTADSKTMERLFVELGFDNQAAAEMSLSVLDERQANAKSGALAISSLEELLSHEAFDALVMPDLYRFVTLSCPRRGVSVWTAPEQVLQSLPGANRSFIVQFVDDRSSYNDLDTGQRLNLQNLSSKPGRLSQSAGPVYTIRSSIMDNGTRGFTQEQLVYKGQNDIGRPRVLRTTFPRKQEVMD